MLFLSTTTYLFKQKYEEKNVPIFWVKIGTWKISSHVSFLEFGLKIALSVICIGQLHYVALDEECTS